MEKEQAQEKAIENLGWHEVAVVYTDDGIVWDYNYHNEARYLVTHAPFTQAKEIWTYGRYEKVWTCYKSDSKAVDYVAETGATGDLAKLLRAMTVMEGLIKDNPSQE